MLSKFELDFLNGKIRLEPKAAKNARYRIYKKVKQFEYLVLPLLEKNGLLSLDDMRNSSSLMKYSAPLKGVAGFDSLLFSTCHT